MKKHTLAWIVSAALAGCVAPAAPGTGNVDDDAPLTAYDQLLEGAPPNSTLPDDNKADAVYPATFDLKATQSPVKSQGSRGVCSIFATVALMESLYIQAGQPAPDFSEQYLQWSVKEEVRAYRNTSGSNARENLDAITRFGIPVESAWPYESFPWGVSNDPGCTGEESSQPTKCHTNGAPPESARMAQKFKLPRGRYLNTNSIKAQLTTKKQGVQVGMDFFYQSWNHRKSTIPRSQAYWDKGYVTYPNAKDIEESHKQRAGHSIMIIGWDDNLEVVSRDGEGNPIKDADGNEVKEKGFYLFKNSWGTAGFGIENPFGAGYGWLSMKYVAEYGSAYVSDLPVVVQPGPGPNPGPQDRFENTTGADIPDNLPAGITSEINVPTTGKLAEVTVDVDITHTYVGDLTLRLVHGDRSVVLQSNQGGGDDNLVKSFTSTAFKDVERGGVWKLEIVDGARDDDGRLNKWSLSVR
jgi:C1A family cysteine protease